ncbi:MAG: tape measure protein [Firmicutes bacterium]|nr:tape measure protein [Bacillota bacterium]
MLVEELIVRMGIDTSPYEKGLDEVRRKSQGFIATISGILKQGLSFAAGMGVFQAMKAGFEATVKAGWQLNQTLSTARLGFITMMGSVDEANRHIREMTEFAARTPFQLEGLISASQQLQGMGIEANRVIPVLRAVGDALSASGKLSQDSVNRVVLALGQMSLRGKVASQEMLQLTEAGIPSWAILAEKMGVSTEQLQEMVSKGLVPAQAAIDALVVGLEERFGGTMDRISKTAPGMWSTLKDNVQIFMAKALQPLYDLWEQKILPLLLRFSEVIQGISFKSLTSKIAEFTGKAGLSFENIKTVWERMVPAAETTWETIKAVIASAHQVVSTVVSTTWSMIGDVIRWVMEHIAPFVIEQWNRIAGFIREILPDIVTFVQRMLGAFKAVWDFYWSTIVAVYEPIWQVIQWVVSNAMTVIFGIIKTALKLLSGDWQGAWEAMKATFQQVWKMLSQSAAVIWGAIKKLFFGFLGGLMDAVRPLVKLLPQSWEEVWDSWRATIEQKRLDSPVTSQFDAIKQGAKDTVEQTGPTMAQFADVLKNTAKESTPALEAMSASFANLGKSADEASAKVAKLANEVRSYFSSRYAEALPAVRAGLITAEQAREYARSAVIQQYGAEGLKALWQRVKEMYYAATPEQQREIFKWMYGVEPPGLQAGGIVTKPGIYQLAERGPEAVIPLNRMPAQVTINITGNHIASDYDVDRIGEQIVRKLRLAGVLL